MRPTAVGYFKAVPHHKKIASCHAFAGTFGDGRGYLYSLSEYLQWSICVSHTYQHPGQYEGCVKILLVGSLFCLLFCYGGGGVVVGGGWGGVRVCVVCWFVFVWSVFFVFGCFSIVVWFCVLFFFF